MTAIRACFIGPKYGIRIMICWRFLALFRPGPYSQKPTSKQKKLRRRRGRIIGRPSARQTRSSAVRPTFLRGYLVTSVGRGYWGTCRKKIFFRRAWRGLKRARPIHTATPIRRGRFVGTAGIDMLPNCGTCRNNLPIFNCCTNWRTQWRRLSHSILARWFWCACSRDTGICFAIT